LAVTRSSAAERTAVFWLPASEGDLVLKAKSQSFGFYEGIAPYGNASVMIARVESSLESVNFRLQHLQGGAVWR
jgi:hypothetical protein